MSVTGLTTTATLASGFSAGQDHVAASVLAENEALIIRERQQR
jgi:hypothetical protein